MLEQLALIAGNVIHEMREEGWSEDDIKWAACGAILKYCEEHDFDDPTSKEQMVALQALVKRIIKERSTVPDGFVRLVLISNRGISRITEKQERAMRNRFTSHLR